MKLEDHKKKIDDFFDSHTPEQLKEMWDKYNYLSKSNKTVSLYDVNVSLLCEFADYILHNANWSESFADKPWYSETLERNVSSIELAELFLNSR